MVVTYESEFGFIGCPESWISFYSLHYFLQISGVGGIQYFRFVGAVGTLDELRVG